MITSLTPEQESKFEEYINRWTAIGLCTDPADRPKAEEAIRKCYEKGGLEAPKKIVWCGSPLSQLITQSILINLKNDSVREPVRDSVRDSIRYPAWDSVRNSISDATSMSLRVFVLESVMDSVMINVRDSVVDSVWDSVWESVRDSVWVSVTASISNSIMASVWDSVSPSVNPLNPLLYAICASVNTSVHASVVGRIKESLMASVSDSANVSVRQPIYDSVCGSHDAPWLSYYSFIRNELGLVEQTEPLTGLFELALHCGWILPYKEICFASERHNVLKRDERGRLHCTDGPAVSYPDGWSIYAVHGVRVPGYIITSPHEITVEKIEAQSNTEVRRIMIDTYGPKRYIEDSGASLIHEDSYGKLYRKDLQDDEPIVMVKVVNSTAEPNGTFKEYFLRVPPNTKTAHEAVAWTFGKQDKTYNPALET